MDQAAGNVEAPAEKPENDEDRENCPKHRCPFNQKNVHRLPKSERQLLQPELSLKSGDLRGSIYERVEVLAGVLTQCEIEYSLSLRYKVVLPMPRARAVINLSPLSCCKASRIACFSSSARGRIRVCRPGAAVRKAAVRMCGGKSVLCRTGPRLMAPARSRQFSSSRTFPGHS